MYKRMIHGPTIWNIDVYGIRTSFIIADCFLCKNPTVIRTWPLVIACCATSVQYNHNSMYQKYLLSCLNQQVATYSWDQLKQKKFNCAKVEFIFLVDCTQWQCTSRLKSYDKHCHSQWRNFIKKLIRMWVLLVCF